jgi:hypothetical protein
MRNPIRTAWALALVAVPLATSALAADPPAPRRAAPPPVIGTHQIDRYDAIKDLQEKVKADPKSLADWVILGELAHEVAMDAPADQAARYARMSREAYEQALKLAPDNKGLQAAVQFARDQEAGVESFERSRDRATQAYLDARRRELAAGGYIPTVRAYAPPLPSRELPGPAPGAAVVPPANPSPAAGVVETPGNPSASQVAAADGVANTATTPTLRPAPAPPAAAVDPNAVERGALRDTPGEDTANYGTRQLYSSAIPTYPMYRPYYVPQGDPLTYQQYTNGYYSPSAYAPGVQPMTTQGFLQQALGNAAARINRATGGPALAPGVPAPGATVPAVPRP